MQTNEQTIDERCAWLDDLAFWSLRAARLASNKAERLHYQSEVARYADRIIALRTAEQQAREVTP